MKNKLFWILVAIVGAAAAAVAVIVIITGLKENNPVKPFADKVKNATETGISTAHSVGSLVSDELAKLSPTPDVGSPTPTVVPDDGLERHALSELSVTYTGFSYGSGDYSMEPYFQYKFYCTDGVVQTLPLNSADTIINLQLVGVDIAQKAPNDKGEPESVSVLLDEGLYSYFHSRGDNRKLFYIVITDDKVKGGPEYRQRYWDAVVYMDNGISVQEWLLYYGYAKAYPEAGTESYDAYYASLEEAARQAGRGVWAVTFTEDPNWSREAIAKKAETQGN